MIVTILFALVTLLLTAVFQYVPVITELPYGIDSILVTGMTYLHAIIAVFPPLGIMLSGFLIILGFKTLMLVLRAVPIIGRIVGAYK